MIGMATGPMLVPHNGLVLVQVKRDGVELFRLESIPPGSNSR